MNVGVKSLGLKDDGAKIAHQVSFLGKVNSTYLKAIGSTLRKPVDLRKNLHDYYKKEIKALRTDTGGSGSTDNTLVPIYLDPQIVDLTRKQTPLVELIPRTPNQGLTADYNVVTDKGDAFTSWEDASLSENDDSYTRRSKPIKYLYSVGRVTGPANASIPSFIMDGMDTTGFDNPFTSSVAQNAKQKEVLMKARALKELEENLIINGDSSSNQYEFDGIIEQQGTTNKVDMSSSAVDDFSYINEAVTKAYDNGGRPNLAVCSMGTLSHLAELVYDKGRYNFQDTERELAFGIATRLVLNTVVGKIPVIPSRFMPDGKVYFLDMDHIEMRVLQDMMMEDLAKTNDSSKFMMKIYETLVVKAPEFNAWIDDIDIS